MPTIGSFISAVMKVPADRAAMRRFFETEVAWVRDHHPEVADPDRMLRSNIGWCFGEGMPLATRKLWAEETGAEHPGFGPEYANREFTFEECLQAGMRLAERHKYEQTHPTAWDLVLRERFG